MAERFAFGTRVVNVNATGKRATVVARPFNQGHEPQSTAVVIDGNGYVTYWPTNNVRELTAEDGQPTLVERFREGR